jgi:hypothetical protein
VRHQNSCKLAPCIGNNKVATDKIFLPKELQRPTNKFGGKKHQGREHNKQAPITTSTSVNHQEMQCKEATKPSPLLVVKLYNSML